MQKKSLAKEKSICSKLKHKKAAFYFIVMPLLHIKLYIKYIVCLANILKRNMFIG